MTQPFQDGKQWVNPLWLQNKSKCGTSIRCCQHNHAKDCWIAARGGAKRKKKRSFASYLLNWRRRRRRLVTVTGTKHAPWSSGFPWLATKKAVCQNSFVVVWEIGFKILGKRCPKVLRFCTSTRLAWLGWGSLSLACWKIRSGGSQARREGHCRGRAAFE